MTYYRGLANLQLDLGNVDDALAALDAGLDATRAEPALVAAARLSDGDARTGFRAPRRPAEPWLLPAGPDALRLAPAECSPDDPARGERALRASTSASRSATAEHECGEARSRLASTRDVDPALRAAVYDNLSELERTRGDTRRRLTRSIGRIRRRRSRHARAARASVLRHRARAERKRANCARDLLRQARDRPDRAPAPVLQRRGRATRSRVPARQGRHVSHRRGLADGAADGSMRVSRCCSSSKPGALRLHSRAAAACGERGQWACSG